MPDQPKIWSQFGYQEKVNYLKQTAPDCSFIVGQADSGPKKIASHRWILSEVSKVFERMFNGEFKEAKYPEEIPLPDENPENFQKFIIFIHYGQIDSSGEHAPETLWNHYKLADKYMCESLKSASEIQFKKRSNDSPTYLDYDMLKAFEFAHLLKDMKLISESSSFIVNRAKEPNQTITKFSCIYDFDPNVFNEFLKLLHGMDNECFKIVEIYAKVNRLVKTEAVLTINGEPTLRAMLQNIDLSKLTLQEFLDGPDKSSLYDLPEKHGTLVKIVSQ